MSEENRNRDDANREETPGRQKIGREGENQDQSGVDKLIDKAAKLAKDKLGGNSGGSGSGGSKGR